MGRVIEEGGPAVLPSTVAPGQALPVIEPPPPPTHHPNRNRYPSAAPAYQPRRGDPEKLLGISDIAAELGISAQAVHDHRKRDPRWLPRPNYLGPAVGGAVNAPARPLWRRAKLVKYGVLPPA